MTIKEIARIAGVSISTVSKIINHKDASISPETRDRVLQIVEEFNYTPYSNAYLSTQRTESKIIGLLIRSVETSRSLEGIIKAARNLGYSILISECDELPELEFRGIISLCKSGVDGILWEPLNTESLRYAETFREYKIPYLIFNSTLTDTALNMDFEQMGYDATMELVQKNHTDIACLLSPGSRTESFLNGYKKCLFDCGIRYQENYVFHDIDETLIHKITSHSITGVVSSHFHAANQLYGELYSLHYLIPYDISIVTLKNDSRGVNVFPKISTITTPHADFGLHLCRQLIAKISQDDYIPEKFNRHPFLDNHETIAIPYTHRTQPLLVIGSINIDTYLNMPHLPMTGKSTISTSSSVYPGGKAVNQAVGVSKLGVHAAVIGVVGSDVDSDLIYEALKEYNVDASGVRRCTDTATGRAFVFVQNDGDSLISILSGANSNLTPDDIYRNSRYFENSRFCLVQTEIPMDTVMAACRLARANKISTILKPSACDHLDKELLPYINILVPNTDELNLLCPEGTISEKADYFLSHGVETVIVTLGAEGCYVKTADYEEYLPSHPFQSVDNTGACDAFISALAVYLQDGYPLKKAAKIANYAGAFSITREGVPNSLIDRNSLEALLRQHEPDLLVKS